MEYEVDEDYPFETNEFGTPYLPDNLEKDGELYILPNGKYLPCDCYVLKNGSCLIYEPFEISLRGRLLRENVISG